MKKIVTNHIKALENKQVTFTNDEINEEEGMSGYFALYPYNYFVRDTKHYFRKYYIENKKTEKEYKSSKYQDWKIKYDEIINQSIIILQYLHNLERNTKLILGEILHQIKGDITEREFFKNVVSDYINYKKDEKSLPIGSMENNSNNDYMLLSYIHDMTFGKLIEFINEIYLCDIELFKQFSASFLALNHRADEKEMVCSNKWVNYNIKQVIGPVKIPEFKMFIKNEILYKVNVEEYEKIFSIERIYPNFRNAIISALLTTIKEFNTDNIYFEARFDKQFKDKYISIKSIFNNDNNKAVRSECRSIIKSMIDIGFGVDYDHIKNSNDFKHCIDLIVGIVFPKYIYKLYLLDNIDGAIEHIYIEKNINKFKESDYCKKKIKQNKDKYTGLCKVIRDLEYIECVSLISYFQLCREFRNSISHGRNTISTTLGRHSYSLKFEIIDLFIKKDYLSDKDKKVFNKAYFYYNQ